MYPGILFETTDNATPIHLVPRGEFVEWSKTLESRQQKWLELALPKVKAGVFALVPGEGGDLDFVVCVVDKDRELAPLRALAEALPPRLYRVSRDLSVEEEEEAAWYWASGRYSFKIGESQVGDDERPILALGSEARAAETDCRAQALVRDLINRPAIDLGPEELLMAAKALADEYGATLREVRGQELEREYPMVAAVGRGAARAPVLIDIQWGESSARKLSLVGKGVVFDSGGLDIKPAAFMRNMKKDMGGAAHALGVAQMIMGRKLPVRLRVLIPAVENAVGGDSYRPGDVLRSRKGISVEIHNTDAEGRLVLADALADAAAEEPELLVDFATLTGAARVALGPDLPAMFSNDDAAATELLNAGLEVGEPMWRLPLHKAYRRYLDSNVADISNAGSVPMAGAITAALFLAEFAGDKPWVHLDLYGWNDSKKAGKAAGGAALATRAVYRFLAERFQ
jgi:leucyl aminopeptidase